jgi:hypothetical protein
MNAGSSDPRDDMLIDNASAGLNRLRFDESTAIGAVRDYNAGVYRGRQNVDIDRIAYERFRGGLPDDRRALIDLVRFVGEEYGGAQRRFLPHGYVEEGRLIVANIEPSLDQWRATLDAGRPLIQEIPDEATLDRLFGPFVGTKRWPVWASKTLHFIRPDAFPILDSRAKIALGMRNLGSSARDYRRYCECFRAVLLEHRDVITAARGADSGESPSDLKLLDKILYQLGA